MTEKDIVTLLIAALFGSLTAYLAQRRGRSPLFWFCIGALFWLAGILLFFLFCKASDAERLKPEILPEITPATIEVAAVHLPQDGWFYLDHEHKQFGPISLSELKALFNASKITGASYVWCEGMQEWKKLDQLPEVHRWMVGVA